MSTEDDRASFLEAAFQLAARLCRDAIWHDGRCNWTGEAMEPANGQWGVVHRALGPGLYEGSAGVALFLGRTFAATGEEPLRRAALGAAAHALSRRAALPAHTAAGFRTGLLGVAWSATAVGEAADDGGLVEQGLSAAREAAEEPPHPEALDVVSGSAGAIPALLDLGERFDAPDLLDAARRHGDHLLGTAQRGERGWWWPSPGIPARGGLTGHSHGAAGMALALLELHAATGEARFREGALAGFAYERGRYDPQRRNWPDLREDTGGEQPAYGLTWCHGAPGIVLTRARAYALDPDPAYARESQAPATLVAEGLRTAAEGGSGFSLCHGAAGNAECLLEAARAFGWEPYREVAEWVGRAGIRQVHEAGRPWPCGVPGGGETPGLMLGLAGIGHFYLRLFDPEATPSVLCPAPRRDAAPHSPAGAGAAARPALLQRT